MQLIPTLKHHSDGTEYYSLSANGHFIGIVNKQGKDYLALGRRKPVKTLQEAALQLLEARIMQCLKNSDNCKYFQLYKTVQNQKKKRNKP